jgi:hypothetical protein
MSAALFMKAKTLVPRTVSDQYDITPVRGIMNSSLAAPVPFYQKYGERHVEMDTQMESMNR